ncbi:ABC transporter permease [Thermocrinis jamiesonii]|jgi:conserved hypothetical protein TIGR00245|uniref:ABC transporter permease n=1 Tax=Thermocrinis jamiesonii TaxID=1302351 RepID=UPI0004978BBD|nr:iron export ABC transporter permease subunit FetB [Thermocrinis jamiesonii]
MDEFTLNLNVFPYTFLLILFVVFVSYVSHLKAERDLIESSLRTTVQLMLIGYALKVILNVKSLVSSLLILLIMSAVASFVAVERLRLSESFLKSWVISFISLNIPTALVFAFLLLLGLKSYSPLELITLWGLILGNSLSNIGLTFERLKSEVISRRSEIEAMVSLGAPLRVAMLELMQNAIRTSMMPKYNMLKSAGIVHIPGVAVGMVVGGVDPLEAMAFQIVVLLMIISVGFLTSYMVINLTYKSILRFANG